jgi:hypothetical protein
MRARSACRRRGLYGCTGLLRSAIMLADLGPRRVRHGEPREPSDAQPEDQVARVRIRRGRQVLESDRAQIVAAHARHERNKAEMSLDPTGGYRLETA